MAISEEELAAQSVSIETPRADFDPDAYERCNDSSLKAVLGLLRKWDVPAEANRRRHGVDVRAGKFDLELACRIDQWFAHEPTFMHICIHLEEGKKKYWLAWPRPVHYVIVRADFKSVGIVWSDIVAEYVRDDNLEVRPNKRSSNEQFYLIPYHQIEWFDVDTGDKLAADVWTTQQSKRWERRNLL